MKASLSSLIANTNTPVIFDGAMGTSIKAANIEIGCSDELCNIHYPEIIDEIHREFIEAGAQVICTNTFQANSFMLKDGSVQQINSKAALIARKVADSFNEGKDSSGSILVGGTMGPLWIPQTQDRSGSGHRLYDPLCRQEIYFEQADVLVNSAADFIILETNFRLDEALVMLEAVKKTGVEIVVTMAFIEGSDGTPLTPAGDSIKSVVSALEAGGAFMIGANCCNGVDFTSKVASMFSDIASVPLLFQPNAGTPLKGHYPEGPGMFATFASHMAKMGVSAVGGCCGSAFVHIKGMAGAVS